MAEINYINGYEIADAKARVTFDRLQSDITNEIGTRRSADTDLQNQISGLASGNPLAASSTADMTDTSRIYVNTTDGYWYYYNGSAWSQGGVYQSSIDSDEITQLKTEILLNQSGYTYFDSDDFKLGGLSQGNWVANAYRLCSKDITKYDYDLIIIPDSDYRFGVHLFDNNDTFVADSGWQTSSYTIPANQKFKIVVAKNPDVTSTITDFYEFLSHYKISTKIGSEVYSDLGADTVSIYNFDEKTIDDLYIKENDINKLNLIGIAYPTGYNLTSPVYFKKGDTITVSDNFISNYKWHLMRVLDNGNPQNINIYNTNNSYTFTNNEYAQIAWIPRDDDWNSTTYNVDKEHKLNENDVTSITYYLLNKDNSKQNLIDLDGRYLSNLSHLGGYVLPSFYITVLLLQRVCTPIIKSKYKTKIIPHDNVKFGVLVYSSSNQSRETFVSDTGWLTTEYEVPANTYFTISCMYIDGRNLNKYMNVFDFVDILQVPDLSINDRVELLENEISPSYTYHYEGNKLNLNKNGFEVSELMNVSQIPNNGTQGFCIYDNYLIQLFGNTTTIQIYDLNTKTLLYTLSSSNSYGHGDSCQVSNTKYDDNDLFPLIYVTADTTPSKVHVLRIQDSTTASVIKTYTFGSEDGYYCGHAFDFNNNIMYSRGYKIQSYTDPINNSMICASYKLDSEINNDYLTLELIERHEEPFVYCEQGSIYFKGYIYISSSYNPSQSTSKIYVIDPYKHITTNIISDLPNGIKNDEIEGVAFMLNDNKYDMIVGSRSKYFALTFY